MKTLQRVNIPKAVMEATFNWVYFYDEISPFVDEAILAHPLKTRTTIAEASFLAEQSRLQAVKELLKISIPTKMVSIASLPPF